MKTVFRAMFKKTSERLHVSYLEASDEAYRNRHSMGWVALDSATHFILAEGWQQQRERQAESPLYVHFRKEGAEPQRLPDGSPPPITGIYGMTVRVDDTVAGIHWDVGTPPSIPFDDVSPLGRDSVTTEDQAALDAIKALPYGDADMLLGVIVNAVAGTVSAITPLHPLTDAELYKVVSSSMPKMIEAQGGPEAAHVALAAAIVRLVRQRLEAGA